MAKKPSKKRRQKKPTKNEKPAPTRVLRWRSPDVGTRYTILYDRHLEYADILLRLKIDPTVNGAHLDPGGKDPEMAEFLSEFSTLRLDLVEGGEQLMRELDDDGADLIERLAIRKWADPHLFEDVQVSIRKWRRKRDAKQDSPAQETTSVTPVDQVNGDGAKSDRGSNVIPPEGEWSAPMSLTEMAKRITGKSNARGREVQENLKSHGLRRLKGNKWLVRLDKMDRLTRQKIEYPNIS